jgi:hypothetical protein
MSRFVFALTVVALMASTAAAQDPNSYPGSFSLGELTPTPEMWFYEQARRDYNNPQMMVRRRAEIAAAQRRDRIAARAWYGISLARPTANPTPIMSHYSPYWGGRGLDPWAWSGVRSTVILNTRRVPTEAIYGIW